MTLLHMDSFSAAGVLTDRYTVAGSPGISATYPRASGSYGAVVLSSVDFVTRTIPATAELFVAAAFRVPATLNLGGGLIGLLGDAATSAHLTVMMNATTGLLELRRGNSAGTLLATGTTPLTVNTYYQVQVRATIADSGGICQVRLNGASTNEIDYTGDTKNAGTNSTIDAVRLANSVNSNVYCTDFVILDTTGTRNNTWPGDCTIKVLLPSGNGSASSFVGSDGDSVNNYLLVDEVFWSATDYVGSPTVGAQDLYALGDLAAGISDVRAVQVSGYVAKSDAGAASSKIIAKSASTVQASATKILATTYASQVLTMETDPATGTTWSAAGVNALEVGVEAA